VFFNLFFEAAPFATILIAHRTSSIGIVAQSHTEMSMNSDTFTHECHSHNDHELCSLNTKSIFQWISPGRFRMQLFYWPSEVRQNLGCYSP